MNNQNLLSARIYKTSGASEMILRKFLSLNSRAIGPKIRRK